MNDNYINKKFGMLTVLELSHKVGYSKVYKCICECGNTTNVYRNNLRNGKTISCGCFHKEHINEYSKTHGMRRERIYSIWTNMKTRCYNEKTRQYKDYGGRGISICGEWKDDFQLFLKWSNENGYNDNLTIERKDVNGNYEPSNCEWIEAKYQSENRRGNRFVTIGGETKTLKGWCDYYGINYKSTHSRMRTNNISEIEAINHFRKKIN